MDHLQLPTDRIWVSIYLDDDEVEIWNKDASQSALCDWVRRTILGNRLWTLWALPEIYIDRGPSFGCGEPDCKPGCDCERFLEFWNLVFIQFHQDGDSYTPLEAKSIDTGMGLERVAALLQGKTSIFDVDNIRPIIDGVGELAGVAYGSSAQTDMSLRVIVDHLRAVTFLVADGVLPSNEGRGYVLRRLLRRAVRHGRLLGITKPFAETVVDLVVKQMQVLTPNWWKAGVCE